MLVLSSVFHNQSIIRISREAGFALFLLANFIIYSLIRNLFSGEFLYRFDLLAIPVLYLFAAFLNLYLLYKTAVALKSIPSFLPIMTWRIILLAALFYIYLPATGSQVSNGVLAFFSAVEKREGLEITGINLQYILILLALTLEWFFLKILILQDRIFNSQASDLFFIEKKFPILTSMFSLLVFAIIFYSYILSSFSSEHLARYLPLLILLQAFSYVVVLKFLFFKCLNACKKVKLKVLESSFWNKLKDIKRTVVLIDSLDLPGQIRLQKIDILDGRAEKSAVESLLLRFAEHFKGEVANALHAILPDVPLRSIPELGDVEILAGQGARALCAGQNVLLGREDFLLSRKVQIQAGDVLPESPTIFYLYLAVNNQLVARLLFSERIMADGIDYANSMAKLGVNTEIACVYKHPELQLALDSIPLPTEQKSSYLSIDDFVKKNSSLAEDTFCISNVETSQVGALLHLRFYSENLKNLEHLPNLKADLLMPRTDLSDVAKLLKEYRKGRRRTVIAFSVCLATVFSLAAILYWPADSAPSQVSWIFFLLLTSLSATILTLRYSKLSITRS